MDRHWGVLGVPSSAGAHTPGIEKGPAALREAGLPGLLPGRVEDHGDTSSFRWRPDRERPAAKNAGVVARIAGETADGVGRILGAGQIPLVLGGDCSITVGVIAGFVRAGRRPALLYVDGGPDLYTPETRSNGNLDAMGMAHLLAIAGHVPEVAGIGPKVPLLTARDILTYGHTLPDDDLELRLMDHLGITHIHANEVHDDPAAAADRALREIGDAIDALGVHFDVDVLSFVDAPIADVPDSGGEPVGLTLDEAVTGLARFAASPRFAGLVITEVNPDHVPEPAVLHHFTGMVAKAL